MKTLLITLITISLSWIALPNTTEAAHDTCRTSYTYRSGHSSCGCATYTRRTFTGYDCHGHALYNYYRVPTSHTCSRHYSSTHHRNHHTYIHRTTHTPHRNYYRNRRGGCVTLRTHRGHFTVCR